MQGKQAKIVSPTQERAILGYLDTTRSPWFCRKFSSEVICGMLSLYDQR